MSFLETIVLAFALTVGSFAAQIAAGPATSNQAENGRTANGTVTCSSPCRIDDPKCRCNGPSNPKE